VTPPEARATASGERARDWLAAARRLPRDKADTLLLLLSSVLVLAPHAAHLPAWITAAVGATLLWRLALTWRGARLPPTWLLLPVSLAAMGGVYLSFQTLLGRDAGVAMLTLLLTFKLLEMHAKRDLFVVIFLSFFLLLTTFFYSQTIATALTMALTVVLLLTAQLSFQYAGTVPPLARRLRLAGGIVALAAPLGLLLFVAFPRVQGPLWNLPGDAAGARSGLSETMSPGNISNLAQSDASAFQVSFNGAAPAQERLYWRAIVLGRFDGRTWTRGRSGRGRDSVRLQFKGEALHYQLTLEGNDTRWLPALEMPLQIDGLPSGAYMVTPELELVAAIPPRQRLRYDISSLSDYALQADAHPEALQPWLQLPPGFNPQTLAWARALRPASPQAAVKAVLDYFREQQFSYTLEPPLLGEHAVDEFLFTTRAGFCEHYAGAFVVLMRAMGVPARVVTGYQGGETNRLDGVLTVRQSDAHAWAEVWLAGRGWLRIDPTAAVAPDRIAANLARALQAPARYGMPVLGAMLRWSDDPGSLLSTLRFGLSAVNHAWNRWVLDYTPQRQRGLLHGIERGFGRRPLLLLGALGAALAAAAALAFAVSRWRQRRRRDPLDALYAAFCRRQARRGRARLPDEGPQRYAQRLAALPAAPEKQAAIARFLAIYGAMKYGVASPAEKAFAIKTLRGLLSQS
jgi:protein-glutamine gamma-glutamyltransferase